MNICDFMMYAMMDTVGYINMQQVIHHKKTEGTDAENRKRADSA